MRCQEMTGDARRCHEMSGDAMRCQEMPGDAMKRIFCILGHGDFFFEYLIELTKKISDKICWKFFVQISKVFRNSAKIF